MKPVSDIEYQILRDKKNNFCLIHSSEELKAFCKTDFVAICFRCHLEKHKTHDVVMLEDICPNDLKDKIAEFENDVQDQSSKMEYLYEKISTSKKNYETQHEILARTFEEIYEMCKSGKLAHEIMGEFEERKNEICQMHKDMIELKKVLEIINIDIPRIKEEGANFSIYENVKSLLLNNAELISKTEKNLVAKNMKLSNLENINIKQSIINTIKSMLFKKEYISTSCIVHYFEWGNKNVVLYDVDKKVTTKFTLNIDFNLPKFCRTVATDDGRIFIIGGRDKANVCCDWILEYKDSLKTLVHKKPMLLRRSDFTPLFSKSGFIYVIGGNDAKLFYKQCEKYDIENDIWIKIDPLNIGRDSAACCIFNEKYIYAFSGRIKFDKKEITNTIEKYSIANDKWELINFSPKSIWTPCDLGMAYQLDQNSILLFGGFDKDMRTLETFQYNTNSDQIDRGPYLPKEGSFSNFVFHYGNSLYVIGWNNSGKNMYQYIIPERIWKIDENLVL